MINQNLFKSLFRDTVHLIGGRSLAGNMSPFRVEDVVHATASAKVCSLVLSCGDSNLVDLLDKMFGDIVKIYSQSYSSGEGPDPSLESHFMHKVTVLHKIGNTVCYANILVLKNSDPLPCCMVISDDLVSVHAHEDVVVSDGSKASSAVNTFVPCAPSSSTCLELLSELVSKMVKEEGSINDEILKVVYSICCLPVYHISLSCYGFLENLVLESNLNAEASSSAGGGHGAFGLFQFRDVALRNMQKHGLTNFTNVDDIRELGYRSQLWLAMAYITHSVTGSMHPNFARIRFIGLERLLCFAPNLFKREDPILYAYEAIKISLDNDADEVLSGNVDFLSSKDVATASLSPQIKALALGNGVDGIADVSELDLVEYREKYLSNSSQHSGSFALSKNMLNNGKYLAYFSSENGDFNNRFMPHSLHSVANSKFGDLFPKGSVRLDVLNFDSAQANVFPGYLGLQQWSTVQGSGKVIGRGLYTSVFLRGRSISGLFLASDLDDVGTGFIKSFSCDYINANNVLFDAGKGELRKGVLVNELPDVKATAKQSCEYLLTVMQQRLLAARYQMMLLVPEGGSIVRDSHDVYTNVDNMKLDPMTKLRKIGVASSAMFQLHGAHAIPSKIGVSSLTNSSTKLPPLGSFINTERPSVALNNGLGTLTDLIDVLNDRHEGDNESVRGIDFISW